MNCELLMIGSELLLGEVVDTNASYLARRLADIGMNLYHKTSVGDNLDRIVAALNAAADRSDVVISSGGLGPTEDDITREAIAKALEVQLEFRPNLFDEIEAKFADRGLKMTRNNRRQAFLPEGATALKNPLGTAPAFAVKSGDCTIIALPGVPAELRSITEKQVLPYLLNSLIPGGAVIMSRELKLTAVAEAAVDEKVGHLVRTSRNPTVGILTQSGVIVVRVTARAKDRTSASRMIDEMEMCLREHIGDFIFGKDDDTIESVIADLLESSEVKLAVVETVTGGAIAQRLVATGTSRILGFEVLPQERNLRMFLSMSNADYARAAADPVSLARQLGVAARDKYAAETVLVVLDGTLPGSSRSWVLFDLAGREHLRDVGLKGRDRWVQDRLAMTALQVARQALVKADSFKDVSQTADEDGARPRRPESSM